MICMEFRCTDLGILKIVLAIDANRKSDGSMAMNQARYATLLLLNFNMSLCNPCRSPVPIQSKLLKNE